MPKRRKAPPNTYWRGDILWGRIRLTGKPATQWSLGTNDPKIAARRVADHKAELLGRVKFGEARRSFEEVMIEWSQRLTDRVSATTAKRYLCSLAQLAPFLEGKFLDQMNGSVIAAIVNGRRANGLTVSTIKRDLVALSSVMGFCIDEGWLEANPVLPRLGRLKERRDPIRLPEHSHIEVVIQHAPRGLAAVIRAALTTGCRQSELAKCKRIDFSDNRRQLTVIGKRNKRRTIDLDDAALAAFRAAPTGSPWMFTSEHGDCHRSVGTSFYRLVRKLAHKGVVPFRFHDLRHRFAVDYLKAGGSIYALQQHLGHTSVKTTEMYLDYLSTPEKFATQFGGGVATILATG